MLTIPASHQDLIKDETQAFLFLATLMPNGSPQVTTIWFDTDEKYILINSAKGRVKDKNMRARAQVGLVIQDFKDPYRFIQIQGRVVEIAEEGALEHINRLSLKYMGKAWDGHAEETRVTYKILPDKIIVH